MAEAVDDAVFGGPVESKVAAPAPTDEEKPETAQGATLRSWFPETFLWAPRVRTDAQGEAEVAMTVPDQLSTWRVFGLSAADDGSVSGASHTFDSALEVFVDPTTPPFLRLGDRVVLPVRVGNLSGGPVRGALRVRGERLGGGLSRSLEVAPGRSALAAATLTADTVGIGVIEASLEGRDTVVRQVEVRPRGEPRTVRHDGLLGGSQEIALDVPAGTTSARARVRVVPGPAEVLRGELAWGVRGNELHDLAYAVALGAMGPSLLDRLGQPANEDEARAFRALRLRAQPQLVRVGRAATGVHAAALALVALRAVGEDDPIAAPVADGLAAQLRTAQLPDGSWEVPRGSSLGRLVGSTAWLALVLDDPSATARARGVFERYAPALLEQEGVEAHNLALVVAVGTGDSALDDRLRTRIDADRARLEADPVLWSSLERHDGATASPADLALALGLAGLDPGASLRAVSAWRPSQGLGGASRSMSWLILLSRAEPIGTEAFEVRLALGPETETLTVAPGSTVPEVVLPLGSRGTGLVIETDAAQTAVGWQVDVDSWSPWVDPGNALGLVAEQAHSELVVGRTSTVSLFVEGPDVQGLRATVRLPAGVEALEEGLEGATWVTRGDGELVVALPGEREARHEVRIHVVPTLEGRLWPGATELTVEAQGVRVVVPPRVWTIRR